MTHDGVRRTLAVLSGGALAGACCGGNAAVIGLGIGAVAVGAAVALAAGRRRAGTLAPLDEPVDQAGESDPSGPAG